MRPLTILILALLVAGCSDTVRTEFKTLDDAKRAKAFDRGWLPPLLPDGSTGIVEVNDLDINTGSGSFRFPSEATAQYLEALGTQHGALVTKSPFGITVVVTNADTRWDIRLDPKKGTGAYGVEYKKQ
jgi:hypothetical protein